VTPGVSGARGQKGSLDSSGVRIWVATRLALTASRGRKTKVLVLELEAPPWTKKCPRLKQPETLSLGALASDVEKLRALLAFSLDSVAPAGAQRSSPDDDEQESCHLAIGEASASILRAGRVVPA
jgi:hypothetical protein